VAGAIGAAPDIIGFYGSAIKKDDYKLYNLVHSMPFMVTVFGVGLGFIPFYWPVGVGLIGYAIHCLLDMWVHDRPSDTGKGTRWWIPAEGLKWNTIAWLLLSFASFFVSIPMGFYSLMVGLIIHGICEVKYGW
jgi:hypothetical protein